MLAAVSAHGSASDRNLSLGVDDLLERGEQVEGAARERSIRVTVTTSPWVWSSILGSSRRSFCARHLLPVDVAAAASGGTKLLKLAVEGLSHGADAGIAETAVLRVSFAHNLREA